MKKKMRAALSLTLAVIMCLSLSVGAFAETVPGTVEVETTAGNNETVDVTITIESTNNADGTTTTETTTEAEDFVTGDGMTVDYSANSTEIKDAEGNLLPGSNSDSSWNAVNGDGSYTSEGGSDSKVVENSGTGTVDVPMTEGGIDTAYGAAAGTTVTTGDDDKSDGIYDYTTETVLQQGSVKVETTKVEVGVDEVKSEYKSDLKYVTSDAETTADNDMVNLNYQQDIPTKENMPEAEDGYQFVLVGNHKASQFWAQYVYTKPQCEDDIVAFTLTDENGNEQKYYYGRGPGGYYHSCYNAEGVYIDGEKVSDDTVRAGWGILEQFLLIDPATGKAVTTYCADIATSTQDGFSYNIENVEDADYYSEEQAAMIRTVAFNGYWGTESGTGSLEAVKQMMRDAVGEDGNPVFTEEEINSLTDGIAMTATQYAIWKFSNSMSEIEFINCQFTSKDENNLTDLSLINDPNRLSPDGNKYNWTDFLKNVPADKQDSVALIMKLYNHLVNMDPTTVEDPDSTNTVITKDNFIKDMSVTVIEKAEEHANNQDVDNTNDAYVTELSFALVVTPSTENGDDMIVQVVGPDGVVAEARIAGDPKENETMQYLTPDDNGNFTFSNITMIEGNQNFNITLQGIQNLKEGVYLYSSEVRTDADGEKVPSQTMVGIASGAHAVNVTMDISFELSVEDEIVASEHVWRTEWDPGNPPPYNPPPPPFNPPEPPPEEIPDEPVPLAKAPNTGGISTVFAITAAVSGMGLAGIALIGKRRDEE